MGKKGTTSDAQIVQVFQGVIADTDPPQLFGAPVWWATSDGTSRMYLWGEHAHLSSFLFEKGAFVPTPEAQSADASAGQPGGILSVSANGGAKGSGIVWAMTPSQDNEDGALVVRATLSAYDAEDVAKRLWTSDAATADAVGTLVKFCPPTIAAGRVFVATGDDALRVYGLRAQE
jgi:hypothetical protein